MPPFYPDQYRNQYSDQYSYGTPYNDQYNQYQFANSPQSPAIPPYSQLQINLPPHQQQQQQQQSPQQLAQYNYHPQTQQPPSQQQQQQQHQTYPPNYVHPTTQFQYQYPSQPAYHSQYQQLSPQQAHIPSPHYHQPMPQYQRPHQQIQVNVPRPQPQPQSPPQPAQRILKDVQPTAPRQQQPPIPKPTQIKSEPEPPEPDYDILLLSLADEYLEAAQKLPIRSEEYFKLISTALGCIDAVLNNFKLPPLREAQVGMRYAQLLLNETENYDDAERVLTKTIDLCERLKYHDLKYGAQLLLTRVLYQSRPKAALKDLQGMIEDLEIYKHTAWEYAFRLQYVMFAASSKQANDNHAAIAQLERICQVSRQYGDHAVFAFAAVLESLLHLHSPGSESVQSSQRALAKARALQLNPDVEENPQISLMIEFVDLCGQIKNCDTAQSEQKRKAMQTVLYPALQKPSWRNDGLMYLPVNGPSLRGLQTQDSGLIVERSGKQFLAFSWLLKDEVEDLGYLLSGVSASHKNAGDGGKAEKFLEEGGKMIDEILEDNKIVNSFGEFTRVRQHNVKCHFLLEMVFLQCSRGQWTKAQATVRTIESVAQKSGDQFPVEMRCITDYVKGSILQGKGDLDAALAVFQSPALNILSQFVDQSSAKLSSQLHRTDDTIRNISILAGMNTIFIIQRSDHPQHHRLSSLLKAIDPLASQHANKNIQAAWSFVLASLPNNTILKTKQYLGNALNTAQGINNAQITTHCLVTMQEKFFKGVVGDQAVKCAKAASHQARRLNEPMWVAVAAGLEADSLHVHGKVEESLHKRQEAERLMAILPERIRPNATAA